MARGGDEIHDDDTSNGASSPLGLRKISRSARYLAPHTWLNALFYLLLFVSVYATLVGFFEIIGQAGETTNIYEAFLNASGREFQNLTFATIAAVAIVGVMAVSAEQLRKPDNSHAWRAFSGLLYIFFAVWSVSFGFAFFWKMFEGRAAQEKVVVETLEAAKRQITALKTDANGAVAAIESAAGEAGRLASREANGGSACLGGTSGSGQGPIYRRLTSTETELMALAGSLQTARAPTAPDRLWSEELDRQIARMTAFIAASKGVEASSPEEADSAAIALIRDASSAKERAKLRESEIEPLKDDLNAVISNTFSGVMRPAIEDVETYMIGFGPQSFGKDACNAPTLYAKLEGAKTALDGFNREVTIDLPNLEGSDGTTKAFTRLTGWAAFNVSSGLGFEALWDEGDRKALSEKDVIALLAAVAIDLGIFFMTFARAAVAGAPDYTLVEHARRKLNSSGGRAFRQLVKLPISQLSPLLHRLTFFSWGRTFVVVPDYAKNMSPKTAEHLWAIQQAMLVFVANGSATVRSDREPLSGGYWRFFGAQRYFERALRRRGVPLDTVGRVTVYDISDLAMLDLLLAPAMAAALQSEADERRPENPFAEEDAPASDIRPRTLRRREQRTDASHQDPTLTKQPRSQKSDRVAAIQRRLRAAFEKRRRGRGA